MLNKEEILTGVAHSLPWIYFQGWWGILTVICPTILSSLFYRWGGQAKKGNWLDPLRNKLTRRLGCMILRSIAIIFVLKIAAPWWIHLISAGIAYGGLTTYWDSIFGYDNHYAHGFGIGLAALPLLLIGSISWLGFTIHMVAIAGFMGLISQLSADHNVEEYGRGSSVIWTQLALLI